MINHASCARRPADAADWEHFWGADVKKFVHGVQRVISVIMWETDSLGQIVSW